jgi:hypothetical protein
LADFNEFGSELAMKMPLNLKMNHFFLAFDGLFNAGCAPYLARIRLCSQFLGGSPHSLDFYGSILR